MTSLSDVTLLFSLVGTQRAILLVPTVQPLFAQERPARSSTSWELRLSALGLGLCVSSAGVEVRGQGAYVAGLRVWPGQVPADQGSWLPEAWVALVPVFPSVSGTRVPGVRVLCRLW